MKPRSTKLVRVLAVLCLLVAYSPAFGQAPIISSFSQNGELVCTNLEPGSFAGVEWAASVTGPWTNNWVGLDAVTADSNGMIRVAVPMFYRVLGMARQTPPAATKMVLIPAGSFTMGDSFDEGWGDDLPLHTNEISAFYMDEYEVTKALWDEVYNWALTNSYTFDNAGSGKAKNHPVQTVSWYDSVKWCNARSEREGWVPAYYTSAAQTSVYRTGQVGVQNDWVKWNSGYRLPTEAEWEKAARGGASGHRFPWADADTITHSRANYQAYPSGYAYDVSPTQGCHPTFATGDYPYTSPAGYFAPNGYGLYDMAGNVWEWCWDWYGRSYTASPATDPRGPVSGQDRVLRGGWWNDLAILCRTAGRNYDYGCPANGDYGIGFRSVLASGQP